LYSPDYIVANNDLSLDQQRDRRRSKPTEHHFQALNQSCSQITGAIGPSIIHSLNAAGFRVQALTRRRQTTFIPNTVNVVEVNYNDDNTLREALRHQDAVVSCLGDVPAAVQAQDSLLKASLAAGVKRFVPSELGSDTTNQHVISYPFFRAKIEHQLRLQQAASAYRDFSYSLLIMGPFIDWALSKVPFIINVGARTAEGIVSLIMACWRSPVGDCTAQLTQLHHSHRWRQRPIQHHPDTHRRQRHRRHPYTSTRNQKPSSFHPRRHHNTKQAHSTRPKPPLLRWRCLQTSTYLQHHQHQQHSSRTSSVESLPRPRIRPIRLGDTLH